MSYRLNKYFYKYATYFYLLGNFYASKQDKNIVLI